MSRSRGPGVAGGGGGGDGRGAGTGADPAAVDAALEVLGPLAAPDAPLGARTTYRVGGPASILVVASDLQQLGAVARAHEVSGLPVLAVGRGSNLLVADRGFAGIAVELDPGEAAFGSVSFDGSRVVAGGAVPMPTLARRSVDAGLTGFEWAVGVPGSLGGAARMNAGGHGSDMARSVVAVTVVDIGDRVGASRLPTVRRVSLGELDYGYRRCSLGAGQVIVGVELVLSAGDRVAGAETIRAIVRWRREHQPGGQNAGSVFTNPAGPRSPRSAGWLVEAAGLKGARRGSASVSEKHANFIQSDQDGSADDVDGLISMVQAEVAARFDIHLATEIRRVGFAAPATDA